MTPIITMAFSADRTARRTPPRPPVDIAPKTWIFMTSPLRGRALPALLVLGVLTTGCAAVTSSPAGEDLGTAPVVAPRMTLAPASPPEAGTTTRPTSRTTGTRPTLSRPALGTDVPVRAAEPRSTVTERAWDRPRPSLEAAPSKLLSRAHAGSHRPVRVVSVRSVGGRPELAVATARGRAQVTTAISRAQDAAGAVAVSVDTRVHTADTGPVTVQATANDTYRSSQWGLTRLDGEHLWTQQAGRGTVVAVVDSGVDAAHPDLNGDVLPGTDYVASGGNGFDDENGHGTHVAGIIAATANNGLGVAGLAQGVKILAVRALDGHGSGWDSDIASGIIYATDHGASVINLSVGGARSDVTASAVSYALSHHVVVVAAAGNARQSGNAVSYPGAYPGVLGVAASDSSDAIADFSNTGSYVDVAAPGVGILSTYPGGYASMSGTSMATPFTAASAALLEAADPALTPDQVDSVLESTAHDLGTPGRDDESGFGLIDPSAALCAVTGCAAVPAGSTPTSSAPTSSAPTASQPSPPTTADPVPPLSQPGTPEPTTPTPVPNAPPSPPAPSTDPAQATTTRILSRARSVRYGSAIRWVVELRDEAGSPIAGVLVDMCVKVAPASGYTCLSVTTRSTGRAAYSVHARAETTVRASYGGDSTYAPSTSATVVYPVAPKLTVRRHHHALTVRLAAGHRRMVTLHRWWHHRWVLTARARVAPGRRHVFRHLAAGRYRVRVAATRRLPGTHLPLRLR